MTTKQVQEFKETEIGKIPVDWEVKKLGNVFELSQGLQISSKKRISENKENHIPLLKIRDLPTNKFSEFVSLDDVTSVYISSKDDIIYTRTGQVGLVYTNVEGCVHNNCFKIHYGDFDKMFVYYTLNQRRVFEYANAVAGGSVQKDLTHSAFKSCLITYPKNKQEQIRIGRFISNLDAKIQNLENQNRILEQMAQVIFKSWFVDFDGVTEFEDSELGKIPKGWSTNILDYIANNIRNTIKSKDITSEIFYIGLEHMPRDKVGLDTWENSHDLKSNKFKFETNHILFGKLRPYFKKVGISPIDGICSTDILVLDCKETQWLEFLLFTVSSYDFIEYASQSTTGTRMPRTDWNYMKNYKIILPPETMVLKFHKIIKKSIEMMKTNIFEIKALTKTRDALLPKLMSGEIRV